MFDAHSDRKSNRRFAGILGGLVVAVVTVVAGVAIMKARSREAPGDPLPLGAASGPTISATSAPATPRPDVPLTLPGMSIDAPGNASVTGEYMTGSVQGMVPIEWAVTWQRGTLPPPDVLGKIASSMVQVLESKERSPARVASSRERTVGGLPGREFDLVNDRGTTMRVAFVACGGRVIQILGGGPATSLLATARMIDSFQCTPDATKDVDREAVAVELRPGWQRTAPTGAPMLVNAREVLVRPSVLSNVGGDELDRFAPAGIRAAGFTIDADTPVARAGRKIWFGSLTLSGKKHPAAVVVWRCPVEQQVGAIYVVSMESAPLDDGIALALTGRCLGADEKAPAYPVRPRR